MNTTMALSFCDPQQPYSTGGLRALLALHALLIDRPIIQDTFLVSGRFHRLDTADALPSGLMKEGVIGVAFRESMEPSFVVLNDQLFQKARAGSYVPFPGDSISTHEDSEFRSYVARLTAIMANAPALRWSAGSIGQLYRAKMYESALHGEFGLTPEDALDAFWAVERLASPITPASHSRSLYWRVADEYFRKDNRNLRIKQWAAAYYLTNLSDDLGIGASVPTALLSAVEARPDAQLIASVGLPLLPGASSGDQDPDYLHHVYGGILNPAFLAGVGAKAIAELRRHPAFVPFQESLRADDHQQAQVHLRDYVNFLYEEAPKYVPQYRDRVVALQRQIAAKAAIGIAAPFVGGALAFISGGLAMTPVVVGAMASLAKLLEKHPGSERLLQRTLEESRQLLERSRYRESILSLVDSLHGAPAPDETSSKGA